VGLIAGLDALARKKNPIPAGNRSQVVKEIKYGKNCSGEGSEREERSVKKRGGIKTEKRNET
jgi:hypothetical protein